jgi:hypothetical protein
MDIIQEAKLVSSKPSFFSYVFSNTEEGRAEILNVAQYALLAIIPITILNKTIQRFLPDLDPEASSIELLAEVIMQILIIFCGLVIIHRVISYIPTYSGYKYEPFVLTNSILTFLVIVLSLQTKLGLKVNELFERAISLWTGDRAAPVQKSGAAPMVRKSMHVPSQADGFDNQMNQMGGFPPMPTATNNTARGAASAGATSGPILDNMYSGNPAVSGAYPTAEYNYGPMPANGLLGSSFN